MAHFVSSLIHLFCSVAFVCCDSVDATQENSTMGRLVNHSRKGSARERVIEVDVVPHICLSELTDSFAIEQLQYDYGLKKYHFNIRQVTLCGRCNIIC